MLRALAQIISTTVRPATNAPPYYSRPPRSLSTIHPLQDLSPQHNTAYTAYNSTHTQRGNVQRTMAGVKRKADEISELEVDDAGPVQVPPYDVTTETSAKSVVTSKEYNKLKDGIQHICQRITEPPKKSEFKDASTIKVVELTEARLLQNSTEEIMVTVTGNMGSGKDYHETMRIAQSDN